MAIDFGRRFQDLRTATRDEWYDSGLNPADGWYDLRTDEGRNRYIRERDRFVWELEDTEGDQFPDDGLHWQLPHDLNWLDE